MTYDLMTVVWKEWREFLRQRGTIRGTISMLLIPSVILKVPDPVFLFLERFQESTRMNYVAI